MLGNYFNLQRFVVGAEFLRVLRSPRLRRDRPDRFTVCLVTYANCSVSSATRASCPAMCASFAASSDSSSAMRRLASISVFDLIVDDLDRAGGDSPSAFDKRVRFRRPNQLVSRLPLIESTNDKSAALGQLIRSERLGPMLNFYRRADA